MAKECRRVLGEVEVLVAQAQAFVEANTGAVEELGHEQGDAWGVAQLIEEFWLCGGARHGS